MKHKKTLRAENRAELLWNVGWRSSPVVSSLGFLYASLIQDGILENWPPTNTSGHRQICSVKVKAEEPGRPSRQKA
jgi:hypothetical protein